jgi:hypothetical protein
MPFLITDHVIERYIERYAPGLTETEARVQLDGLAAGAVRVRQKTLCGDTQWANNNMLFVTRRDRGNGAEICVTILPKDSMEARRDAGIGETAFREGLAEIDEFQAEQDRWREARKISMALELLQTMARQSVRCRLLLEQEPELRYLLVVRTKK